jgi:hypothetical protein
MNNGYESEAWMDPDCYKYDPSSVRVWGGVVLIITFAFFSISFHILVSSKLLPEPGNIDHH